MSSTFTYQSAGSLGQTADFARVAMRVGCCTGGVAGTVYEATPGQDLTSTIGYGPLAMADARAARLVPEAQRYALKVAATTAGTISSVTKSGSGSNITVAGSAFDALSTTPWIAGKFKAKVIKAGALGIARIALAIDGGSYNYEFDLPAESPATVIGTVDVSAFTWGNGGTVDGLTIKIGATTVTFNDPADSADMLAQLETGLTGYAFDLVQGKYLRVRSDAVGASATFTIDALSTADATLGLSNAAATGAAATITVPGTGLVLTAASGTYVLNETYSWTTTAPRASLAAMLSAITTAAAADPSLDFGLLVPVQAPLDEVDLRAYADGLDGICTTWEADEDRRSVVWLINSPLSTADADVKLAMASHVSTHGAVAVRDCYLPSAIPQPIGRPQTLLVEQLAIRCAAAESFSEDPGNGEFGPLECTVDSPDGVRLARLDSTATVKMGGSKGPGFTALTSKRGRAYFARGVTRAGSSSRFVDLGVLRATKAFVAVLYAAMRDLENKTFELNPNGTIAEFEAAAIDNALETIAREQFVEKRHFSRVRVAVNRTADMSETRALEIEYLAQIRGQGEDVRGKLLVAGTINAES